MAQIMAHAVCAAHAAAGDLIDDDIAIGAFCE
jgi:hypothetical protein